MGSVQERGIREVLDDAEGLANVLRNMSGGKLDLQVVSTAVPGMPPLPLSWGEARTDAALLARRKEKKR